MIQQELVRATIIPVIVHIISGYYGISIQDAFHLFYTSKTEKCLADDDTGLYGQSPLFLVSMFIQEKDGMDNVDVRRLSKAADNSASKSC